MPAGGDAHDVIEARAAEVVSGRKSGHVELSGKLVPGGDGVARLVDATGRCPVYGVGAEASFAWVVLSGEGRDGALHVTSTRIARACGTPVFGADLAHFEALEGRRAGYARLRARARSAVRSFFDAQGYLEVETPAIVRNPGSDLHLDAFSVDGLGAPRFLSTSPELQMKRLVATGLDRIYQLRFAYRRDEVGVHHEPEFTMLEWYRAFADHDTLLADTEALIVHVADAVLGASSLDVAGKRVSLARPWPRRTIREVYRAYVDPDIDAFALDDETFFRLFAERIQPMLGEETPEHVVEWPARFASLARISASDPSVAERVETFVAGIELSNGFVELVDADEQAARFAADEEARRAHGKVVYARDTRFIDALRDGLPDTVGNALGFDRLVMLLAGAPSIADVIAIPHART